MPRHIVFGRGGSHRLDLGARASGGIGRRAGFRFQWATVWVRLPLPVPARRKRHITCDELFHFIVKLIVRSFCRSSLPNRTRSAGLRLGAALWAAVFALVKISVLTVLSTWWQSSLCDHVFLCLRQKRRHPPAPLLFLFKSNPLRRASIWILIQTDSHCIFF